VRVVVVVFVVLSGGVLLAIYLRIAVFCVGLFKASLQNYFLPKALLVIFGFVYRFLKYRSSKLIRYIHRLDWYV